MKTVAIIQARNGNTRLPKKNGTGFVLAGKPMVWRVFDRIHRAKTLSTVVGAIPHEPATDDVLEAIGGRAMTFVVPGDASDLIRRYNLVAKQTNAQIVVRIPADNPCIDPDEIDRIVTHYHSNPAPWDWLTTNLDRDVLGNGYPGGLGAEVYDARFFTWADDNLTDPRHREHPHRWAMENGKVRTIQAPADIRYPWLDFSVNTISDFNFIADIYHHFQGHTFESREAINYVNAKNKQNPTATF